MVLQFHWFMNGIYSKLNRLLQVENRKLKRQVDFYKAKVAALERRLQAKGDVHAPASNNGENQRVIQAEASGLVHLFDQIDAFVYRCTNDESYSIQKMSPSVFRVTGYTHQEFLNGGSWLQYVGLVNPDDLAQIRVAMAEKIKTESKFYNEYRIKTKTGGLKWIGDHSVAIRNERGEVIAFEGAATDITSQKTAHLSLKATEERFRKIFELSPAAIVISDYNTGLILMANKAFERITGWTEKAYRGKTKEDIRLWGSHATRMKFMKELNSTGCIENREYQFVTRQGVEKSLFVSASLLDDQQAPVVLTVLTDVTSQKRLAERLNKEKNFLDTILGTIPEPVWIKDSKGIFINCNCEFEKIVGKPKAAILGKTDFDFFDRKMAARFQETDLKVIRENKTMKVQEWVSDSESGEKVLFETIKTPMYDAHSQMVGVLGIARNITELKRIEQELVRAKDEAEHADRLKSAFLATMSHELRTPLNAIIGFSGMIEEDTAIDDLHEMVRIIHQNGNDLLHLIEDIFNIALLQSKIAEKLEARFSLYNLCESLKFYIDAEILKSEKTHLKNDIQYPRPNENILLYTDQTMLLQLMTNFLSNAVKYSDSGTISLTFDLKGKDIVFCVKDQGIGIAPDTQRIIFDWFRQVDDSFTREYGGIGLGLAICREISDLLQGKIWVESELGQGAAFYFQLHGVIVTD
jgi:PAS domain S-box-containing protein